MRCMADFGTFENRLLMRQMDTIFTPILPLWWKIYTYVTPEFLQSRAGKQAVVDTHVEGIIEYLEMRLQ